MFNTKGGFNLSCQLKEKHWHNLLVDDHSQPMMSFVIGWDKVFREVMTYNWNYWVEEIIQGQEFDLGISFQIGLPNEIKWMISSNICIGNLYPNTVYDHLYQYDKSNILSLFCLLHLIHTSQWSKKHRMGSLYLLMV